MEKNSKKYIISFTNNKFENFNQNFSENASKYEEIINKPIFFNMIKPISSFIGRDKELNKINESILMKKITVISGFGGIGKTELVRFYAWKHKNDFDGNIVWINAEPESTLNLLIKKLATQLLIPLQYNAINRLMDVIIRDIYLKLNKKKCLIIFDNAKNKKSLQDYLPQEDHKNISVLITSHNQSWRPDFTINLSVLDAEDACKFLEISLQESCSIDENKANIKKLAKELQYLPLALQQAAACINYKILDLDGKFSVLKYIEEFEKKRLFNFCYDGNLPFPDSYENSYDKTLFQSVAVSVDFIEKSSSSSNLTLDILHISSYLAPNNISKSIFDPLQQDEDLLNTSLHILTKYSLLQKFQNEDEWQYNIHRLVQLSYRYIRNSDGFCEKTAKKTLLLTTKNIFSNVTHYTYILDLIMNDKKNDCEYYFDDENVIETLDYKLSYYELLKSIPNLLENYVKFVNDKITLKGDQQVFYEKLLAEYKKNIENFVLNDLQMRRDFFDNPTYEAAEKLHESIIQTFIDINLDKIEQTKSHFLKKEYSTVLYSASMFGHIKVVQYLKNKGFNIDIKNSYKITPLFMAAQNGHKHLVKFFVENKCDINVRAITGETPLFVAALNGSIKIVKYLLENGANLKILTNELNTPLHAAAQSGHEDIVRFLVEKNCNVNFLTKDKVSALMYAADKGHIKIVKYLIQKNANVNQVNVDGFTALYFAAEHGFEDIVRLLIKHKSNVNLQSKYGETAAFIASRNGHLKVLQLLKENGAEIRETFLQVAAEGGHLETVKYLVNQGCNINYNLKNDGTPLFYASKEGQLQVVQYLIEKGANINQEEIPEAAHNEHYKIVKNHVNTSNKKHISAVCIASGKGHLEVVQYLCQNGADINQCTDEKYTPLYFAAFYGYEDIVRFLIKNKCDINLQSINGETALYAAAFKGHYEIVKLLVENKAEVDKRTVKMCTPLHEAATNGYEDIVRYLVENGSDVNALDENGWSVADMAFHVGHYSIVQYLLQKNGKFSEISIMKMRCCLL